MRRMRKGHPRDPAPTLVCMRNSDLLLLYQELQAEWLHCGQPPRTSMNVRWQRLAYALEAEFGRRGEQLQLF